MTVVPLTQVLSQLSSAGIAVRIATKKLAAEEAPASYKDVSQVGQRSEIGLRLDATRRCLQIFTSTRQLSFSMTTLLVHCQSVGCCSLHIGTVLAGMQVEFVP